jgi:hypothetical protein
MFRRYILQPVKVHDEVLDFEWDPDSGELAGRDAEIVRNMCRHALRAGYIHGHPYPTAFDITNPLHMSAEMAVVLGQFWQLDGDLGEAYPP